MSTISQVERPPLAAAKESSASIDWRAHLLTAIKYLLMSLLALIMLIPLLWMLSGSLKLRTQIFAYPPQWFPDPLVWQNYIEAWTAYPFDLFTLNSVKIAGLSVLGQLIVCSMGGYGFARFHFPFKNVLFGTLIAVMMVPTVVNIVPLFILFKQIGWLDTHLTLIVPTAVASTFGTFLFRQFMLTIPLDLEDAARIDGAGPFVIYWRIMLPLCKATAAVLATFTFIGSWNALFQPLIFLQSVEKFPVTVGLSYFRGEVGTEWNLLMAASVLTLLPTILVFLFTQKYFVRGIALSGIK